MAPKELEQARPRCDSCTREQKEASEWRPFVGLKTRWAEFYLSQTERLSRIAARIGVPPDQIADVVQDVWLDASKHREGFQGEDVDQRLSSWLGTVVRSKSRDALRRVRRRRTDSLDGLPAEPVDRGAEDPEKQMEEMERDESLAALLEELRKEDQLNHGLVCGHILEGRSLSDLATETGLGGHAISCRISWTLKKLRGWLGE